MRPPRAEIIAEYPAGYWRVWVAPYGRERVDVTFVRGIKTRVSGVTTTDPFGPAAAQVSFPAVTLLDEIGGGDLWWLLPESDIDLEWVSAYEALDIDGETVEVEQEVLYTWEGYLGSFSWPEGLTVSCIGANRQLDNHLAKPEYLYQPLPYEAAIARCFEGKADLRVGQLGGLVAERAKAIKQWAPAYAEGQVPGPTTPYRALNVAKHGYAAGDRVRVVSSKVAKGYTQNGRYRVAWVVDADHFVLRAPSAGHGQAALPIGISKQVLANGYVIRESDSMFPDWWTKVFNRLDKVAYPDAQPWLLPAEVSHGQRWTGMLTRNTGNFEPSLTNYIQGLLANMHTPRGQFTLLLGEGRKPYLSHRNHLQAPDATTLVVDMLWPGVKVDPTVDFTQRIGVIYARGKSTSGDTYTGMQVTADGESTWYDPAAYRRQVHPPEDNPWLDKGVMRKEVVLDFSDGLDQEEAWRASSEHLQRFSRPGTTATIVLNTDPVLATVIDEDGDVSGGDAFPRQTITAGRSILVRGLFGRPEGVLFHVTETSVGDDSEVTLTVDSLFRDHLTVDQVRKRGRDSLVPYRMLSTAGTYDPKIPDLLYPWSYAAGSGVIPYGGKWLFTKLGPTVVPKGTPADPYAVPFPWLEYTTAFPPQRWTGTRWVNAHADKYIRIGPADNRADNNWANRLGAKNTEKFKPYAVHLAAAGEIKLLQIAAYDRAGNVKRVPFHVSLWYTNGISWQSMPMIPAGGWRTVTKVAKASTTAGDATVTITGLPTGHGLAINELISVDAAASAIQEVDGSTWYVGTTGARTITYEMGAVATQTRTYQVTVKEAYTKTSQYPAGEHYPFFPEAWEKILPDGRTPTNTQQLVAADNPLMYGVGTFYEKAGYWPGSSSDAGDDPTGLFVDETGFSFDFRGKPNGVNIQRSAAWNAKYPNSVRAYLMIYCDAQGDDPVYFLGRAYRKEYQG